MCCVGSSAVINRNFAKIGPLPYLPTYIIIININKKIIKKEKLNKIASSIFALK